MTPGKDRFIINSPLMLLTCYAWALGIRSVLFFGYRIYLGRELRTIVRNSVWFQLGFGLVRLF